MFTGSPVNHMQAVEAEYRRQFPADTAVLFYFGPNALAQNTARTRVVYVLAENVEVQSGGFVGRPSELPTLPLQGNVLQYWMIEVHCFSTHDVLFNKVVDNALVPGLIDRVRSAVHYSVSGPFEITFANDSCKMLDMSSLPSSIWEYVIRVSIPIPAFDLSKFTSEQVNTVPIGDLDTLIGDLQHENE